MFKISNMFKISILLIMATFYQSIYSQTFSLKSKELGGQATLKQVFKGFGCDGENISPDLYWENPPVGTKSYALTIHDESAPTGSGWWHWLIFDIPNSVTELKSNAGNLASGLSPKNSIQSKTDFGTYGFGGPCPPVGHGIHKYTITIYALKIDRLGLDQESNPAVVGYTINANTLQKASLVFYYQR